MKMATKEEFCSRCGHLMDYHWLMAGVRICVDWAKHKKDGWCLCSMNPQASLVGVTLDDMR